MVKSEESIKRRSFVNALLFIFLAILINIVLSKAVLALKLPVYFDCVGTILAAMLGGNLPAVIVGFFSNVINGFSDITTLYYGIISILIGVAAALFQRKGFFKTPGKIAVTILVFSFLGGGLGSVLTYFLFGYDFGEGVSAPLAVLIYNNLGFSKFFSQLATDILLDVFDKTLVVAGAVFISKYIPQVYKKYIGKLFLFDADPQKQEYEKLLDVSFIKRSLLKKVVVMVIFAEVLLGVLASVTGFLLYRQVAISKFIDLAHGVTKAAAVVIDAERIDEFLEKGRGAESYAEIEKNLYRIKESFPQTTYLYVYKILEDGCHVVFDLDSEGGVDASQPGEVMEFDPTFVPYLPKLFKGEEIEPIVSDDQFGKLLTVYKPLKGSTYVAADIAIGEIAADEAKFVIKLLSMFFG